MRKNYLEDTKELSKMKFTIGGVDYHVPISWEAITFAKYLEWVNEWVMHFPTEVEELTGEHKSSDIEYPLQMLSFQTDIPYDIITQIGIDDLVKIRETQYFWFDFETLNDIHINHIPQELVDKIDIEGAPAQYMIEFVHGVNGLNGKQPINLAPDLIKNYFKVDILPEPVTTYYGLATFFLSRSAVTGLKFKNKYNLNRPTQMRLQQVSACFRVLA